MPFQIFDTPEPKKNRINAVTSGLLGSIDQGMGMYQQQQQLGQQEEALRALGLPEEAIKASVSNPKILEALIGGYISEKKDEQKNLFQREQLNQKNELEKEKINQKNLLEQEKQQKNIYEDESSYRKIKDTFGDKFAEIWKAAPVGGRTELLKHGIDAKLRGLDLSEALKDVSNDEIKTIAKERQDSIIEKSPPLSDGKIPKDYKWPKFDQRPAGYTPKEWNEIKSSWRKENAPIFDENKTRIKNTKRDLLGVKSLDKLNETRKIGEGFQAILINPETGEFYGPAQAAGLVSPEGQQWVKEIARFQNRAKDAFGSRVTNFDLQSYMKQFPGLLNSYEGRNRILKMMKANYEMDNLYDSAIQQIYDKYGLNGIAPEEADKLARSFIRDETERLEKQFIELDQENINESIKQEQNNINEFPPPDQHSGRKIMDEQTGSIYQSNGKEWIKVK